VNFFFIVPHLKSVQKGRGTDKQEKEEGTFRIATLRCTPLPQRIEQPKSPEAKSFDVPVVSSTYD
jgi:ATP-dependent helicase/DNAse subunit B